MFSRRFPRRAFAARTSQALISVISLTLLSATASANGNGAPRSAERPVARMVSSSPRPEAVARVRARVAGRSVPTSSSYAPAPVPVAAAATSGDERRAFELINAERQRRGLRPLVLDGSLTRLARYHSNNMARVGILNHVDTDGLDIGGRAQALGLHGWKALGENIAYNQGYPDPSAFAVERWMISDKHRENILNGEFTHAGLGVARGSDGRLYFTQVFMKR